MKLIQKWIGLRDIQVPYYPLRMRVLPFPIRITILATLMVCSSAFMPASMAEEIKRTRPDWQPVERKRALSYQLFHPGSGPEPLPLVVFLHGAGERGSDNKAQLKHGARAFTTPESLKSRPCIVIAPQCPADQWWRDANLDQVIALAREWAERPEVDASRVYFTGLSMGGFGTWQALADAPDLIAAAIPICGGGDPVSVPRFAHVPVRVFHGADDRAVMPERSREMVAAMVAAGGDVKYTEYPGVAHDSWTRTYADPEVHRWLFSQRKTENP